MNGAMLYEDYMKLREAEVGSTVEMSDGTNVVKKEHMYPIGHGYVGRPTKNMNLDFYDGTYVHK